MIKLSTWMKYANSRSQWIHMYHVLDIRNDYYFPMTSTYSRTCRNALSLWLWVGLSSPEWMSPIWIRFPLNPGWRSRYWPTRVGPPLTRVLCPFFLRGQGNGSGAGDLGSDATRIGRCAQFWTPYTIHSSFRPDGRAELRGGAYFRAGVRPEVRAATPGGLKCVIPDAKYRVGPPDYVFHIRKS